MTMRFVRACNLPKADAVGSADPYLSVGIIVQQPLDMLTWQSSVVPNCLNPEWGEELALHNLTEGAVVVIEVWDEDMLKENDLMGTVKFVFDPTQQPGQQQLTDQGRPQHPLTTQQQQQASGQSLLTLALQTPHELAARQARTWREGEGAVLQVELSYAPSSSPGVACTHGPVRFRQHLSLLSGALAGHWTGPDAASFSTYRLYLHGIDQAFHGARLPYDPNHLLIGKTFIRPLLCSSTRAAHASLYSTHNPKHIREGWLHSADELYALLGCYCEGKDRRYFTYVLSPDTLRFSQTGAAFFKDKLSKHALHANCEDAVFAGEFCVFPKDHAPPSSAEHEPRHACQQNGKQEAQPQQPQQQQEKATHAAQEQDESDTQHKDQAQSKHPALKLVIDNNSGSYSPPGKGLQDMRRLLLANFPELLVEVLDVTDEEDSAKLKWYHQQVLSRLSPSEKQKGEEHAGPQPSFHPPTPCHSTAQENSPTPDCSGSSNGTINGSSSVNGCQAGPVTHPATQATRVHSASCDTHAAAVGRGTLNGVRSGVLSKAQQPVGPHAESAPPTFAAD